jgi:hypothetical protein
MIIGVAFSRGLVSIRVIPSIGWVLPVWATISSSAGSGIGSAPSWAYDGDGNVSPVKSVANAQISLVMS